jgi:anaerobic nitric oxide reductase transcription regulator
LEKNKQRLAVQGLRLDREAKQVLLNYQWPGNIRELEHLLSRAALKAVTIEKRGMRVVTISLQHLDISTHSSQALVSITESQPVALFVENIKFKQQLDDFSRCLIQQKLAENDNNMAKTAEVLGLDRGNFFRLLKRLEIR